MLKFVFNPEAIDKRAWWKFVESRENSSIFQTPFALELFKSSANHEPILICAYDKAELVGILLGEMVSQGAGVMRYLSSRCIINSEPVVLGDDDGLYTQLLLQLSTKVKDKAVFTEFRNERSLDSKKVLYESVGFSHVDHLNIIVDLTKSEEKLWHEVDQKRRNEIRRAEREGTEVLLLKNMDDLDQSYDILREVYSRVKLPLPKLDYFKRAFNAGQQDYFKIFLAINGNKIIGTMYTLCYKSRIYDWYAGAKREYYNKYPNDLLPWKVFLWGKANGYRIFDFGGAGKPGIPYGVRDYKKKFGGGVVNYGRFIKINKPIVMRISKIGFELWRKM